MWGGGQSRMALKIWGPRFSAPGRMGVPEGRSQDHRWSMESQSLGALILQDPPFELQLPARGPSITRLDLTLGMGLWVPSLSD